MTNGLTVFNNRILKKLSPILLGLFMVTGCGVPGNPLSQASPSPATPTLLNDENVTGSLPDLVALGQPLVCDFVTTSDNNAQATGQIFINQNAFRVNATFAEVLPTPTASPVTTPLPTASPGPQAHVIGNSEWVYVWSENDDQGIKAQPDAIQNVATELEQMLNENDQRSAMLGLLENSDYTCSSWQQVDETLFDPPQTVEFMDVSLYLRALELRQQAN
jgi:hypothetical protein